MSRMPTRQLICCAPRDMWNKLRLSRLISVGPSVAPTTCVSVPAKKLEQAAAATSFFAGTDTQVVGATDGPTLMSRLNRNLFHMSRGAQQMSCLVGILDMVSGELEVTNGAHPFPFVYNRV